VRLGGLLRWAAALGLSMGVGVASACSLGPPSRSPVQAAIFRRDVAELEELLEDGADPDRTAPGYGRPLGPAVEAADDPRYAELLIEHGADVHHRGSHNWTYLHRAVRFGHPRTVELLLEAGADPCVRVSETAPLRRYDSLVPDARGMTPSDLARAMGNEEAVAALADASASC
jgi:ankyrin repeat protein